MYGSDSPSLELQPILIVYIFLPKMVFRGRWDPNGVKYNVGDSVEFQGIFQRLIVEIWHIYHGRVLLRDHSAPPISGSFYAQSDSLRACNNSKLQARLASEYNPRPLAENRPAREAAV
jgi:hypothetical protein